MIRESQRVQWWLAELDQHDNVRVMVDGAHPDYDGVARANNTIRGMRKYQDKQYVAVRCEVREITPSTSANLATTIPADTPWLIGIAGRAGHGKDTVGAILADYGYQRVAFADKVREAALAIDPIVATDQKPGILFVFPDTLRLSHLVNDVGWDRAKQHKDVRQLLQRIGTEVGRNGLGEYVWINALLGRLNPSTKYVITDVRFENEVESIRALGGTVWFVDRPGCGSASDHASERLSPAVCDRIIVNDGTVDDLRKKVERVVKGMLREKIDG